jgi:hypothetical protein
VSQNVVQDKILVLDVFAGYIELPYHLSEIENIDVIQVCRINFLNVNRGVFMTFLLPIARANRPVDSMPPISKNRYEAAGYTASPI